jgi:hypothetical protein
MMILDLAAFQVTIYSMLPLHTSESDSGARVLPVPV